MRPLLSGSIHRYSRGSSHSLHFYKQTGPLDFEDTRNQENRRRGGASAPPRTRLGVPPSKFCSARYRHFENLVSRKIQSLRNPESIKYSVLFIVRLSLSTIPCLSVCLNAKYQSTPPPPHPSHDLTPSLPAFLSPLFAHVHIKYRTSEQVDRPGQAGQSVSDQDHVVLDWLGRYTSQPNHYLHFHSPAMALTRLEIIVSM